MINHKIQNLKDLPLIPSPPPPSHSLSESHHFYTYAHLEASNLVPPELFASIKGRETDSFLSSLSFHSSRRVHISELMKRVTRAGNTMLHLAAIFENLHILEPIAQNFPHLITWKNVKGDTVLHVAARSRNAELIRIVLECYAENFGSNNKEGAMSEKESEEIAVVPPWRIENKHGNMALHEAVMACNVEGVEVLFEKEKSVTHCMNKEGKSALYLSVERGNYKIIRILLEAPFSDTDTTTHQGTSPLHAAIFAKQYGVYIEMPKEVKVALMDVLRVESYRAYNVIDECTVFSDSVQCHVSEGEGTKYSASQPLVKGWFTNEDTVSSSRPGGRINPYANHDLLKELVEKRPELLYMKDKKGNTPLHCAAAMGDDEGARIIVNANPASALEWNEKGYLPIHVACRKGNVGVVKLLVEQSWFDPMEALNPKGQNILHIAAKRGKDRVVKYLVREKEVEVVESLLNQKDKNGNTPLHLASKYLFPKVLLLLTQQRGLDVNLLNNDGMTARDIVMFIRKSPPTIRELLSYAILNSSGSPLSHKGRKLRRVKDKTPQVEWIKDRVSTILLVAILVATVTFAAGFTMPGGFHDSDNSKDIKKLGTAILLNRRMFQLFTICDVVAMYSSTMGSFILLWAQLGDFHLALSATYVALYLVGLALVTMSIAFMAALHLVVGGLSWLAYIVMIVGITFIVMFLVLYIVLTFPLGTHRFLLRHISNFIFRIIIPFSGSYSKFKNVKDAWRMEILVSKDDDNNGPMHKAPTKKNLYIYTKSFICNQQKLVPKVGSKIEYYRHKL
ncbi:protein ACCELERATED CELL DEATH 6-like [Senna tora]|uniref:Protein ACCELERATED CELL DEATH 6-like n=1 Tax=Senna tora TaxID=362788 RepID=A0A834XCP0_9FABA|nr:protein ACCELERATED CELL DEATH 6-like [Senna tora]